MSVTATQATETLRLIRANSYNLMRPSTYVLEDLLEIVDHLAYRVEELEDMARKR